MFHILSIEGAAYDVPLESLREREELKRIARSARARKLANGDGAAGGEAEGRPSRAPTYAEKAYREALPAGGPVEEQWLRASEIMSHPVVTIAPELSVAEGWQRFRQHGVRHMPVLAGSAIVGIVSERDLLRQLIVRDQAVVYDTGLRIGEVMASPVISASPETDIRRIARVMFEHRIGTMPVLDGEKRLAGIVTRSDILYALIHHGPLRLWA